jgi:hypothetical protein
MEEPGPASHNHDDHHVMATMTAIMYIGKRIRRKIT